jgi:hypothetical protein
LETCSGPTDTTGVSEKKNKFPKTESVRSTNKKSIFVPFKGQKEILFLIFTKSSNMKRVADGDDDAAPLVTVVVPGKKHLILSIAPLKIHSITPIIGALLWRKLTDGQVMTYGMAFTIVKKIEPAYSQVVRIASLGGGDIAVFALSLAQRLEKEEENDILDENGAIDQERLPKNTRIQNRILNETISAFPESRRHLRDLSEEQVDQVARTGYPLAINQVIYANSHRHHRVLNTNNLVSLAFWKFVHSIFSDRRKSVRSKAVDDTLWGYQVAKCTYETRDLVHPAELNTPAETAAAHAAILAYYHKVAGRARAAIDTWTMIAVRVGIVKDIRNLLARALWEERHTWAMQERIEKIIAEKRLKRINAVLD